jgi:hypothetical protein
LERIKKASLSSYSTMNRRDIPASSIANQLRTNCCFSFACETMGILLNGNQMGLTFCAKGLNTSPQTARSGKFLKLLKCTSIPSQETILDIDNRAAGVASLFYSPFWKMLYSIEINELSPPFDCLDINVQQQVFEPELNMLGNLQRKVLYKKEVNQIFEIGSLSALSCLLLLRNQFDKQYSQFSKYYLDKLIRYSYVNICATDKLPSLHWDIFSQICNWLQLNTHSEIKQAPSNEKKLTALKEHKVKMVTLFCRKVKTSMTDEEMTLLASLTSIANDKLVYLELSGINEEHQIKTLMPKDEKGLSWLISKLNSSNTRSEHVRLIQTNKHIQIAYPTFS